MKSFVILLLLFPLFAFSQECDSLEIRDSYGVVIKSVTDSTMVYVTKSGKELLVPSFLTKIKTIDYKGGLTKLKEDIFKNVPDVERENHLPGLVYILFNSKLRIIEIRAICLGGKEESWES